MSLLCCRCSVAVPVSSIHDLRSEELLGCETMRACLVHRQGPGASSSGAHAQNNERLLAATLSGALFRREGLPVPVSMKRWLFFVCCIANPIQRRAVVFRRPGFSFTPPASSSRYPPARPRDRLGRVGVWTHTRFEIRRESTHALPLSFRLSPPSLSVGLEESKAPLHAPLRFPVIGFLDRGGGRYAPTESRVFLGHEAAVPDVSCELEHRAGNGPGYPSGKVAEKLASGPPRFLVCLSFLLSTRQCSGHEKHLHPFHRRAWDRRNEIQRLSFFFVNFFKKSWEFWKFRHTLRSRDR